jgi:glycine betaine/proline transport system ATP-binding protein
MNSEICIDSLWKIYGGSADSAIKQLQSGLDPLDLYQRTGLRAAVRDVSLEIQTGEIFVVMGLSGSGKSTLLRLLNGLVRPCSGEVSIQGRRLSSLGPVELNKLRREQMGMVFQSFALFPHRTVIDNAAFGLEVAGVPRPQRRGLALKALERVGLGDECRKYPHQLSGGMQQRVGLARALALDPPILLMDEAFSALDPLIRSDMQELLLELQAERQRTIVFISHDLDEAIRLGDRIALMQDGQVLQCGTAQSLLSDPASLAVRHFFRDIDSAAVLDVAAIAAMPNFLLVDAAGPSAALDAVVGDPVYVLDESKRLRGVRTCSNGWIVADQLETLRAGTRLRDAMPLVASLAYPPPVVDSAGCFLGVITPRLLLRSLEVNV